jgi:predicted nucleic acid-binding protein
LILLDSSVLIAFFNERDVHSAVARQALRELDSGRWGKGLILEYVFVETVNVIKRKVSIPVALEAGRFMQQSRQVDLLLGAGVFANAWDEFRYDLSSPLSFVDLAVAHVARERAGGKVLTFNRAFHALAGIKVEPG